VKWIRKSFFGVKLTGFFLFQLVKANIRIALEIITPQLRMNPAFVPVSVSGLTDLETMLLSNLVCMTPGTLSVELLTDKKDLVIHVMYFSTRLELVHEIEKFKHLLLGLTR
jgi:multicomponent Na+:H+ antiporter subunit E